MFSKQTISGLFYLAGMFLAWTGWLIAGLVSVVGATLLLKVGDQKLFLSKPAPNIMGKIKGLYHLAGKELEKAARSKRHHGC